MGDVFTPYETSRTGDRTGTDQRFVGIRVCSLLDAQVTSLQSSYDPQFGATQYWPGASGTFSPILRKYHLRRMPGDSKRWELTLYYQEPEAWEVVRPNKAMLFVRVTDKAVKLLTERVGDKRVIEGPAKANDIAIDGMNTLRQWKPVVAGSNVVLEAETDMRVRTASTTMRLPVVADMIGKVNSKDMPNFQGAKKHTLMFRGCEFTGLLIARQWWAIDYRFRYNPEGWKDDAIEVQQFYTKIAREPEYDATGAATGRQRTVVSVQPVLEDNMPLIETRTVNVGEADFSNLNAWLAWY